MALLVSCPHCLNVFPTPHGGGNGPIHCAQCRKAFFLTDDVNAAGTMWYVLRGGKQFGPYPLARLRALVEECRVVSTDQLTRVGARPWVQAGSIHSLFPQEDLTPPPKSRKTMGDSDELIMFDPAAVPITGPLSHDGIRLTPERSLTLGDFQILRKLGAGGMGAVYLAWQRSLGRRVALKVLAKNLAKEKAYVDRFYREADTLAGLAHPNIIGFYGVGQERKFPYFAMEYVEGISTAAAMRRLGGRLPIGDAVHIALQCARALRYAHANQIVHRDVKPENVMITRLGHIKITDLGLAKPLAEDMSLTDTGVTLGTPKYMAPEQAGNAKHADHRADLYALGGVLYHYLTGEPPFHADTAMELQLAKQEGRFRPVRTVNPDAPARLDLVIHKLLACERRKRYQSADELIRDLETLGLAGPHLSFNPLHAIVPDPDDPDPEGRVEILLIHDRTEDIILAQEALEEQGMPSNLSAVEDGREAMAYLRGDGKYAAAPRPALILLGRNLRAGGLEFLAEVHASDAWRSIPVVLLTDDAQTADLLAARGLRVSLSVARPDGKQAFAELVRSIKNLCETIVELPRT